MRSRTNGKPATPSADATSAIVDDMFDTIERNAIRTLVERIAAGYVTSLILGRDEDGHYLMIEGTTLLDFEGESAPAVLRAMADRIEKGR